MENESKKNESKKNESKKIEDGIGEITVDEQGGDNVETMEDIARGYDLWAKIYDTEMNPLIALEEKRYPESIVKPYIENKVVLDIGCGTGRNMKRMLTLGASKVIGLDISSGMLEKAKEHFKNETRAEVRLNETGFEFKDVGAETIDLVTACLMLEHIKLDELKKVFKEMHRVLKPGGCVMVTEMHPWLWELGGQAQFTDTTSGTHIIVRSYRKSVADYLTAALKSSLRLKNIREQIMDTEVSKSSNRAKNFENQPMLLWYLLEKPEDPEPPSESECDDEEPTTETPAITTTTIGQPSTTTTVTTSITTATTSTVTTETPATVTTVTTDTNVKI